MSRRLDTMSTGGVGGTDTLKLDNFPEKFLCGQILLRFFYPVTITAPASTPSLQTLMNVLIQSLTIRYGVGGTRIVYPAVPGIELRDITRAVCRVDLPNNIASISWAVPSTVTLRVDLAIPFMVEALTDGRKRVPGWSQMQTVILDLVEGVNISSVLPNTTRAAGNMLVDVDVITYPSDVDQCTPILSYFRANQASLKVMANDGLHLLSWEESAAQASTAIQLFSSKFGGSEQDLIIPPYVAGDQYLMNWDTGISPITDRVTIAVTAEEGMQTSELPSGEYEYSQASQYVSTLQLRGLYWPPMMPEQAQEMTQSASRAAGGPVKTTVIEAPPGMSDGVRRSLPMVVNLPDSPAFLMDEGLLVQQAGAQAFADIPPSRAILAGSAVDIGSVAGAETQLATSAKQAQLSATRVPGVAGIVGSVGSRQTTKLNPNKYLDALQSVAGAKGKASVDSLQKALKR